MSSFLLGQQCLHYYSPEGSAAVVPQTDSVAGSVQDSRSPIDSPTVAPVPVAVVAGAVPGWPIAVVGAAEGSVAAGPDVVAIDWDSGRSAGQSHL